jgi:hypothetical protein
MFRRTFFLALAALVGAQIGFLPARVTAAEESSSRILDKVYASANQRLARGDAAGAISGLRLVAETVPELPEPNAALALAMVLADFSTRDEALPHVRRALASEPANPVAGMIAVIVDPALSVLKPDGALYLTSVAVRRLESALSLFDYEYPGLGERRRLLTAFGKTAEPSGDQYYPIRLPRLAQALGPYGRLALPGVAEPLLFASMFIVDVASPRFAAYDNRLVERMQEAVDALLRNHRKLEKIRVRLGDVRDDAAVYGTRLSRIEALERTVAEIETSADEREKRLLMVELNRTRTDPVEVPAHVERERAWVAEMRRVAAEIRVRLDGLRAPSR